MPPSLKVTPVAPAPTVLVVDDVADARDMLARLLRLDGYTATTAADGAAALAAVEADAPDLMVLDMTMPDMDGLDVLRRLRDRPGGGRGVRVVVFSAVSDPRWEAEARRLGAADYIVKGTSAAAGLLGRLARLLPPTGGPDWHA